MDNQETWIEVWHRLKRIEAEIESFRRQIAAQSPQISRFTESRRDILKPTFRPGVR